MFQKSKAEVRANSATFENEKFNTSQNSYNKTTITQKLSSSSNKEDNDQQDKNSLQGIIKYNKNRA